MFETLGYFAAVALIIFIVGYILWQLEYIFDDYDKKE
jgi:hypothetical protein